MNDDTAPKSDTRLIERWLPIAALGIESLRERTPMTPFPAPNRLHVWWARRPLVASRAAVLASVMPADASHELFMHILGIHGDPVGTRRRLDLAKKSGEHLGLNPYGYCRSFQYKPDQKDLLALRAAYRKLGLDDISVLDPTAGGGSIPLESTRLGLNTFYNDLNPVAALIERATCEYPLQFGASLLRAYRK
jgi:putative DNA methylase